MVIVHYCDSINCLLSHSVVSACMYSIAFLLTLLNALQKSTNTMDAFFPETFSFSIIRPSARICGSVDRLLRKPFWFLRRSGSIFGKIIRKLKIFDAFGDKVIPL